MKTHSGWTLRTYLHPGERKKKFPRTVARVSKLDMSMFGYGKTAEAAWRDLVRNLLDNGAAFKVWTR